MGSKVVPFQTIARMARSLGAAVTHGPQGTATPRPSHADLASRKAADQTPRRSHLSKWLVGGAGVAVAVQAHERLSVTSLFDGKGGFTSDARLRQACALAETYYQRYHSSSPEDQARSHPPLGAGLVEDHFAAMLDFRSSVETHITHKANTEAAHQSLVISITCMKGLEIKPELLDTYNVTQRPKNPDLTKSPLYDQKNKYALIGIPNEATGSMGYTSRSITQPFVNKGHQHFKDAGEANGLSPKQAMEALDALLAQDTQLSPQAQLAAGRAILNFRQLFAADDHWGNAESVVMKILTALGLLLPKEAEKLDASLMFEDPSKNILKRNTGVIGPLLHKLDTRRLEVLLRHDPAALADMKIMANSKNMENLNIAHFKLNEKGNGFEDCSGLGDSFTTANAVACMNFARLLSGQPRLSKADVEVIIACVIAVYNNVGGMRHTARETARGCYVGAGYTIADADEYCDKVNKDAAQEFYGGKALIEAARHPERGVPT